MRIVNSFSDDVISMAAAADLECCRLLLPCSSSLSAFTGFLTTKSATDYYIELKLPEHEDQSTRMRSARLSVDWRLDYILRPHRNTLIKLLEESESVSGFVRVLTCFVDQLEAGVCVRTPLPPVGYYTKITDHLAKVGWRNVLETSSDLTTLKLIASDDHGRCHVLSIHITPARYPDELPLLGVEAPAVFQPTWSPSGALASLLAQFKAWLRQFQHFWSVMELVDSSLWVLEPLQPTKAANSRRVVVDNSLSLSMYLEVDWRHPCSPPQCSFLGPDRDVAKLKEAFYRGRQTWDDSASIVDNLKRVLRVEFSSQPKTATELDSIECSICYQGNEEGGTPDICCDNCSKYYHKGCLLEWFKGLPTSIYTTFQSLSGECPYCNKRIAVKA